MRLPFLALTFLCVSSVAYAQGTLNVSGQAMIYAVPDEVVVGLGIETFDTSLALAKTKNDTETATLLRAVHRLGVEPRHVQTDTVEVSLQYRDSGHPSQGIEGYFVRRAFTVTLKNPKLVEDLVTAALSNGANRIMGLEYRTTELRKLRDEARRKAVAAAREKAALLAGEMSIRIGHPVSINEGYSGSSNSSRWWGWNGGGVNFVQNVVQAGGEAGPEGSTIPLGQIGVSATVSVTFSLAS
jgi:uncharacterized protein YggE